MKISEKNFMQMLAARIKKYTFAPALKERPLY
jgi:hypothetical protein